MVFTLRSKLLLLLILLPLVCMLLYSIVAIDLFQADKIAYVHDTSSSVTEALAQQVNTEVNSIIAMGKLILKGYSPKRHKFSPAAESIFKEEHRIRFLAIYSESSAGDWKQEQKMLKDSSNTELIDAIKVGNKKGISLSSFYEDQIKLEYGFSYREQRQIIVMILELPKLASSFNRSGVYTSYLLNPQGMVLLGPPNSISDFSDWQNLNLSNLQSAVTTKELPSPGGVELIAAIGRISKSNGAVVISMIEKEVALAAVGKLVSKSFVFFIVVISMAVLLSFFAAGKLTSTLSRLSAATKKVALGDFDVVVEVKTKDEVGELAGNFNSMALKISELVQENVQKARMESELKTAQAVQKTLFPAARATLGSLAISGNYESASECGGDWWHYSDMGDKVLIWIGDATGHGAPAALITSAAKTISNVVEEFGITSPKEALRLLNKALFRTSGQQVCMTFFVASIDKKTGHGLFSTASHISPFVVPNKKELTRDDLIPLIPNESSNMVGADIDTAFIEEPFQMKPGEKLFFYTDGVTELYDANEKMFGERRLIKSLLKISSLDLDASLLQVKSDLDEFRLDADLRDDVTFLICQYNGASGNT